MPAQLDAVRQYASGKKYLHARQWYAHDYSQYKVHYIVPGRTPRTMYCQVTRQVLNQIPAEIEKHMAGRKYKTAKEAYEANIERQRQVSVRREEKARIANERGWNSDKPKKDTRKVENDDEDEAPQLVEHIEQQKPRKKAWHEDLSDLYPDARNGEGEDEEDDEDDNDDAIMAYMEEIAESDPESGEENGNEVDEISAESEESDEVKPMKKKKDKSKESKRKKKESDDEDDKKEKKKEKKSKKLLSKQVEEDLKGRSKSMKEQRKESKEKREKKSKRKSEK